MLKVAKVWKTSARWGDFIRGEYWINPDGSSDYADGDIGDKGHEVIALDRILGDKLDELSEAFIAYFSHLKETSPEDYEAECEVYDFDAGFEPEDFYYQGSEDPSELYFSPGIPSEVGKAAFGGQWDELTHDPKIYYLKYYGAIRVINNNFEVWKLTSKQISLIQEFVLEQADEQGVMGEDGGSVLPGTVNVEEVSTRRWASSLEITDFLSMNHPGQVFAGIRVASRNHMIKTSRIFKAAIPTPPAQVYQVPASKTYHIQGVDEMDAANKAVRASLGSLKPSGNTLREAMNAVLGWPKLKTTSVKGGVVLDVTPEMQRAIWKIYEKYDKRK